jgi:RNA polymerase sigma-70 factor (ECF subfamily)
MSDSIIKEEILKNKDNGFKLLVEKYHVMIYKICFAYTKNIEDAEDLTQEVFLKAYQKIDKFRGDSSLSTWLYRISVNKSINFLRDNKYHKLYQRIETLFSDNSELKIEIPSSDKDPEDRFILNEMENLFNKALNTIPKNQMTAFILNKYNELSYQEIAEIMKTSVSAIQSLIHRAKEGIQKRLIEYYDKEKTQHFNNNSVK